MYVDHKASTFSIMYMVLKITYGSKNSQQCHMGLLDEFIRIYTKPMLHKSVKNYRDSIFKHRYQGKQSNKTTAKTLQQIS